LITPGRWVAVALAPQPAASMLSATGAAAEPSHRLGRARRAAGHPGLVRARPQRRPGRSARPIVHRSLSMACLIWPAQLRLRE